MSGDDFFAQLARDHTTTTAVLDDELDGTARRAKRAPAQTRSARRRPRAPTAPAAPTRGTRRVPRAHVALCAGLLIVASSVALVLSREPRNASDAARALGAPPDRIVAGGDSAATTIRRGTATRPADPALRERRRRSRAARRDTPRRRGRDASDRRSRARPARRPRPRPARAPVRRPASPVPAAPGHTPPAPRPVTPPQQTAPAPMATDAPCEFPPC